MERCIQHTGCCLRRRQRRSIGSRYHYPLPNLPLSSNNKHNAPSNRFPLALSAILNYSCVLEDVLGGLDVSRSIVMLLSETLC
mmetsp:Transcript_37475/g.60695  ORF Transcript_37475/g.60695 Transcript_37475/m.60695 type:complete len:83 (-) Transcript_37475:367-615(-)